MKSTIYNQKSQLTKDVLTRKCIEKSLSTREIARQLSCSKSYVRNKLIQFKISLRRPNARLERQNDRIFGRLKVAGKVTNNRQEQAVIKAINQMYKEGLSPTKIAKMLNTMKVRGKKWYYHTIIQILKRQNKYKLKS